MEAEAQVLYRRGVADANEGRLRSARRLLERAERRAASPDLRARITGTLAYVLSRSGEPEAAIRLCEAALADPALSDDTRAVLHGQLGALWLHQGGYASALEWLTRGIDGGSQPAQRANMLVNRSVVHSESRRLDDARADLDRAAALFLEAGDDVGAAMAEHNSGYISLLEGQLITALTRMQRARPALQTSPVNVATCDLDRAEVLRDAGLSTEAEQLLADVARTFGAHRLRQGRGEAELSLARSLLFHAPADAARVAGAAARRFRALGSSSWAARADAVRLRASLASGVRRTDAVGPAPHRTARQGEVDRTADELEVHGLRADAAALRLTWVLSRARSGDLDPRMPRVPDAAPIPVQLLAQETRAARATARGRHALARSEAAAGVDRLTGWQSSFGALDLQSSLGMHGMGLMFEGLASAVRSGRVDVVFEWSERARQVSQQVIAVRPPPDPRLAADLEQLRLLRLENPDGDYTADPRAQAARDRARERQWSTSTAERVRARATLDELQAGLADDTALLSFVFSGATLSCLVVTAGSAHLVDLGGIEAVTSLTAGLRADLDMAAAVRAGPLAAAVQGALRDRLARLSALLLDAPLRSCPDAANLVVTAPGILGGMPWAMMPALSGRAFTLATSASGWLDARRSIVAPRTAGFAAGPRVARAEEEIAAAAALWPGANVLTGDSATVDAVTELASQVDVLHVAAHGRHAIDNPLFSGLELVDGTLFGYDIDRMPRPPRTVVLSACEVGRSSVRWGEEAIGMTRAWLHAGSGCVVAAPVVVADDVACELLGAMHEGLAAGRTPARSLADAAERTGLVAPLQCHGAGF